MSNNLQVALSLVLNGQQTVASGVAHVGKAVSNVGVVARGATAELKRMYDMANGFSSVSKMVAFAGGAAFLRNTENVALQFQKMQLDIKQTAGLTRDQVEEISRYAKESAAAMLSTPTAMLEGAQKLANAGTKWESLLPILKQAASDAAAFRATVGEMANMDFDISTKMNIDSSQLSEANNMLLYHARSGRFEAPAMSRGAPELFTYASKVGLTGVQGLNLVGAMTQQVMKGVAPDQQTKVLTNFEQGLSHIVTPHYLEGLGKVGIDVEKYMPKGKFYGEGGVAGFIDLVKAMKAKGLGDDTIKMARAGFADKETKDFWFQMMQGVDDFDTKMREASAAAKSNQTGKDREDLTKSAVGQEQQSHAKLEKEQLGAEKGVDAWERIKNKAADNPLASIASILGIVLGARYGLKQRTAKKESAATSAAEAASALSAARPQNVMVLNWPKSLGSTLTQIKPNLPDAPTLPGQKESKLAKAGGKLVQGVGIAAEVAAVGYAAYQATSALMETETGEKFSGWLAEQAAKIMAAMGNKEAQQIVNMNTIQLDGQTVATSVNTINARVSRRN